jgi:hypothetical protein
MSQNRQPLIYKNIRERKKKKHSSFFVKNDQVEVGQRSK